MISKMWGVLVGMMLACAPCLGVSTYLGLQPGQSTRDDVARVLGQPVRGVSATCFEYNPQAGTGKIYVEFRSGPLVVDRIDVHFLRPISRSAMVRSLNLSEKADAVQTNTEGQLMEYFGSIKSLVLTYTSEATSSGVSCLGYYSRELFERVIGQHRGSQLPGEDGENSTGRPFTPQALAHAVKPADVSFNLSAQLAGQVKQYFQMALDALNRNDMPGALVSYQQAFKIAPQSAALNFNLSLVHEHQGQLIAAIDHAMKYLTIAPHAADRAEVVARIGHLQEELRRNPRAQYNPADCHDLYLWAQTQNEAAKRSKDVERRQAILGILIAAQKGDCENARNLTATYKQRYR
jgi:hypothetical protein